MTNTKWLMVYGLLFMLMGALHWTLYIPAFVFVVVAFISWWANINHAQIILRDMSGRGG